MLKELLVVEDGANFSDDNVYLQDIFCRSVYTWNAVKWKENCTRLTAFGGMKCNCNRML